jgi:AAA15 family ATPase/GTPase
LIKISLVRIQNFLSYKEEIIVRDIYPISVFVGANNAGKSNFIKSLAFYQELLLYTDEHKGEFHNTKDKFHLLAGNETFSILVRYKFEDQNFSLHPLEIDHLINFKGDGKFDIERFFLRKEGSEITVINKENGKFLELDKELVNNFLFNIKSNVTAGPQGIFNPVETIKYVPFYWTDKSDNPGIKIYEEIKKYIKSWIFIWADRLKTTTQTANTLLEGLLDDREFYDSIVTEMCRFTGIKNVNFRKDTNGNRKPFVTDRPGISTLLDNQGSGVQQIFNLYPQLFQKDTADTVFFIEEPEINLHALLQRKLLETFIKKSQTGHFQFFITTQSPIFCRYQENKIRPYLVSKDGNSTRIKELGANEMNEIKSVLGHVNTDLFGYNAVLFVEGDSEFNTIPLLASNLGIDIVYDGIRIADSKGYGNMRQIKNIIDLLKDTATEVYALSDNHAAHQGSLDDLKTLGDHYTELPKNFEDSFNTDILIEAFQDTLQEENLKLSDTEIATLRNDLTMSSSNTFGVLVDTYRRKTRSQNKPSKVRLGEHIASKLAKSPHLGKSEPEKLIVKIHDKVTQQMNLE